MSYQLGVFIVTRELWVILYEVQEPTYGNDESNCSPPGRLDLCRQLKTLSYGIWVNYVRSNKQLIQVVTLLFTCFYIFYAYILWVHLLKITRLLVVWLTTLIKNRWGYSSIPSRAFMWRACIKISYTNTAIIMDTLLLFVIFISLFKKYPFI